MTDQTRPPEERPLPLSPGLSTKAVHAGEDRQKPGHSMTDPIFCTATYTFADTQAALDFVAQKQPRDEYARYSNPGERGDEIVLFDECYHRTRELCVKCLGNFGVVTRLAPACDYRAMEEAITPATRLLVSESPTNPHLSVVDLERFC